jgi:hypothetical protein
LTLAFGLVVEQAGARGVAAVHIALGLAAAFAWLFRTAAGTWSRAVAARGHTATAVPPSRHGGGP